MKTWIKTSLAAALAATVGLGATAAVARGWGDCDGPRGGPQAMQQRMGPQAMQDRAELRLARLEIALGLTEQQTPAWNAFKGAMTERAERMQAEMQKRFEAGQPKTALERLDRMEEMSTLRQTEMAGTRKAVESLYSTLSDAQKTVFDAEFHIGGGRHGMRGSRHGMGEGFGRGMGPGRG